MEKKSKKSIILGITGLMLVTLLLLGLTYAYYRTRIIGNNSEKPSISVTSKNLEIKYLDGASTLNMEGLIEPGFKYTKTFSVENTGNEEVTYALYLEDVVNDYTRTQDWEMEITCSPNCSGTNGVVEYPKLSEMIRTNSIASGTKQTYNVTINYLESDENQSIDMGATLKGKFQIYSPEDVVDIEGTIAKYNEGDYVQINSIEKKSQIVNGKYRLPAVEVGNHTLRVMSDEGEEIGKTSLTIEKGEKEVSNNSITISDNSHSATVNITNVTSDLNIEVQEIKDYAVQTGTLVYKLFNDNRIKQNSETITSVTTAVTEEKGLYKTADDYGDSWYFRGAQSYNYVNFAGFTWRVVRVNGDGSIRLILNGTIDKVKQEGNSDFAGSTSSFGEVIDAKSGRTPTSGYMHGFLDVTTDVCIKEVNGVKTLGDESDEQTCTSANGTWMSPYDASNMNLNDSVIKVALDNFYEKYIKSNDELVADGLFCGEKTVGAKYLDSNEIIGDGYSNVLTYYKGYSRLFTSAQSVPEVNPTLECDKGTENNYSRYTSTYNSETKTSKGVEVNNDLKYPIALLSADELVFAGAYKGQANTSYYLHNDNLTNYWWTMTPASYTYANPLGHPTMFVSTITNDYYSINRIQGTATSVGVRPVINLKSDVLVTDGDGTSTNPYIIK